MLLAQCVNSQSDFLETTRDEMVGTSFDVLVSFHTRNAFLSFSPLFVRLGFCLFCARLAVRYFAVYPVSGSLN